MTDKTRHIFSQNANIIIHWNFCIKEKSFNTILYLPFPSYFIRISDVLCWLLTLHTVLHDEGDQWPDVSLRACARVVTCVVRQQAPRRDWEGAGRLLCEAPVSRVRVETWRHQVPVWGEIEEAPPAYWGLGKHLHDEMWSLKHEPHPENFSYYLYED